MKKKSIFLMFIGMIALVGCVSKSQYQSEVSSFQGQVLHLTDQVRSLDQQVQEKETQLSEAQVKNKELVSEIDTLKSALKEKSGEVKRLIEEQAKQPLQGSYQTPSGFELQSIDIQSALKNAGYYEGEIDGKIGPGTRQAIRDFQTDNGMAVDGICGRGTWDMLRPYLESIK